MPSDGQATPAAPLHPPIRGFAGQALFKDPSVRALERVGVIDVGSNSVRMVVFDGAARSPAYFFNEKVLCGLGRGMARATTTSSSPSTKRPSTQASSAPVRTSGSNRAG